MTQENLFGREMRNELNTRPLAHRRRPSTLTEYEGWRELSSRYPFLKSPKLSSLVFWGPPGCGKTTLARILATEHDFDLTLFNAVTGGVPELKKILKSAPEMAQMNDKRAALFIDEIHRFNKAQQDALLPSVEQGEILLMGATTENPRRSLNPALQSRVQLVELPYLGQEKIQSILKRAIQKEEREISQDVIEYLSEMTAGDARKALSFLELLLQEEDPQLEHAERIVKELGRSYDRDQNRHYDVISAFIKSVRGSDPDAALLYLAVMLDGGEDPVFIARRLVILASEDIGNADPSALTLAVSALQTVQLIGMPEARITLAQATTYLAATVKSNAAYLAINSALDYVQSKGNIEVPDHLKNFPPKGSKPYLYPHSYEDAYVVQDYSVEQVRFYEPKDIGVEKKMAFRLQSLKEKETYSDDVT